MSRLGAFGISRLGSLGAILLLAAVGPGCGNEAKPDPNAMASGSATTKASARTFTPPPKVDPKTMKEYRVDVCVYGTLTLKHARDAYLGSLGKDEPSEKKLPSFGSPPPGAPPGMPPTPAASGSGSAKAHASAPPKREEVKPPPKPTGSAAASAAGSGSAARAPTRPLDVMVRAPHEKNARGCKVASGLKDPAMPDVDKVLAEYAPYAEELAKNIAQAQTYYQREEYKKDNFEKGKDFHKKLTDGFAKLDEHYKKLDEAAAAWRKANPHDLAKAEEGEKQGWAATEDARDAFAAAFTGGKVDAEALKKAAEKFAKSLEALKNHGTANGNDPWPKILVPALEQFDRALKTAQERAGDKGLHADDILPLVTSFTGVIEARHRALSRALIVKNNPSLMEGPGRVAPGRPMPGRPGTQPPADPH